MPTPEQPDTPLLLRFTPVPLARTRAGGWTAERQVAFIAALGRTGVVKAAAASVGMSARSAYQLRDRCLRTASRLIDVAVPPEDLAVFGPGWTFSFAHAWDLALRRGLDLQMEAMLPVALKPRREPIVRRGRVVGWRKKFDLTLAINALGAWRRQSEFIPFDHEMRIDARTAHLAQSLESLFRLGPAHWPDPATRDAACAGCGRPPVRPDPPDGEGPDGFRHLGILDPWGSGDRPRPAAEQARERPSSPQRPMPRGTRS